MKTRANFTLYGMQGYSIGDFVYFAGAGRLLWDCPRTVQEAVRSTRGETIRENAMTMQTRGHSAAHPGLRGHTVGTNYPYTVIAEGKPDARLKVRNLMHS